MKSKYIILFALISLVHNSISAQEEDLLLKDYDPVSVYNVPKTHPEKAKFPVIDMHSHPYANSKEEIETWVKNMDKAGIKKTILLTYETGSAFDSIVDVYSKYKDRFELWCGFDYTGYNQPGWTEKAITELERCYRKGARGVGELGDKGKGLIYSKPTPAMGMHLDDPRMVPLLQKCGELGMPVNIHVAEPYWMYLPIDKHNDGLMNAKEWQINPSEEGLLGHADLIKTLDNALSQNEKTVFIACHYANCSYDLDILADLLKRHQNLYADISARYAETAPIPRHVKKFITTHQDRLLYGTDMGFEDSMYSTTFRILESEDEHFYEKGLFGYHWALNGFGLPNDVLKKLYFTNAQKLLRKDSSAEKF